MAIRRVEGRIIAQAGFRMGAEGEKSIMSAAWGNREYPPDYIPIPERLRSKPLSDFPVAGRLPYLFASANLRSLGDLHGKRLSDFEGYRNCGKITLLQLRDLIRNLNSIHGPGGENLPMLMAEYRPVRRFVVAPGARNLAPSDLLVSTRLRNVLCRMGLRTLGDLDGRPVLDLFAQPGCGYKVLGELEALVEQTAIGVSNACREHFKTAGPSDFIPVAEELISHLAEQARSMLLLRYGGDGQLPWTLERIGNRFGRRKETVRQKVLRSIDQIRRRGSAKLKMILDAVAKACRKRPLSSSILSKWTTSTHRPRHHFDFYLRLIKQLRPDIPVKVEPADGRRRSSAPV